MIPSQSKDHERVRVFWGLDQLRNKISEILKRVNNDPELEQDFRRTYSLYENDASDSLISQVYQEYISEYQKIASTYIVSNRSNLHIYNTEIEKEELKVLQIPEKLQHLSYITQLPNNELFFIGENKSSYISFIIDKNYKIKKLPPGLPNMCYGAIYFDRSVYCFGSKKSHALNSFRRFNLDQNRWIELTKSGNFINGYFNSVIFNRNILFTWNWDLNFWLYSIDIDSFSTISYTFAARKKKILINAGERLYLIECKGWIYESEVGDIYNLKQIGKSIIESNPSQMYYAYNKGGIYISVLEDNFRNYFKFDLNQKNLIEIAFYCKNLGIQRKGDNFETIEHHDEYFKNNQNYAGAHSNNNGDSLYVLGKKLKDVNEGIEYMAHAWNSKGNILDGLGIFFEAVECYNKALNLKPNYVEAYINKGDALSNLARYSEAIECYNEVIKLKPDNAIAYNNKGQALYNVDRNLEAIQSYNDAINSKTDEHLFYQNRANALNKLGRQIEALQDFNKADDLMKIEE